MLTIASAYLGLEQLDAAAPLIDEVDSAARMRGDSRQMAEARIQRCRMLDLGNHSDACPALLDEAEGLLDPSDPAQARQIAYSLALRVYGHQLEDHYDAIVDDMQRGLRMLETTPANRFLRVELSSHLAFALNRLGRPAEAQQVLTPWVAALRGDEDVERVLLLDVLGTLSSSLSALMRHDEAIAMQREAIGVAEALYGSASPRIAELLNSLTGTLSRAGHGDEAIETIRRTVALDRQAGVDGKNPDLASALCNLGVLLVKSGRDDEAAPVLDEAVSVAATADFAIDLARSLRWRATLHLIAGRISEARADADRSVAVLPADASRKSPAAHSARALSIAADFVEGGSPATSADACAEIGAIASAYPQAPPGNDADADFARYLTEVCRTKSGPTAAVAATRLAPHHVRIADRLREALRLSPAFSAPEPGTAPASR